MPETTLTSVVELTTTIEVGQGPSGPAGLPGLPGAAQVVSLTAAQALGGHRALIAQGAAGADYADSSNVAHYGRVIGISTGAATSGGQVDVQSSGPMEESGWTWTPGLDIWLGANGLLTQTFPVVSAFSQRLGFALTATRIWVDISEPVISE